MESQKFEILSTQSNIDRIGKKVTSAHNGIIEVKGGELCNILVLENAVVNKFDLM